MNTLPMESATVEERGGLRGMCGVPKRIIYPVGAARQGSINSISRKPVSDLLEGTKRKKQKGKEKKRRLAWIYSLHYEILLLSPAN